MIRWLLSYAIIFFALLAPLPPPPQAAELDPLPSWHQGATKQRIIEFVTTATDESNVGYVPVGNRVATFDNDGTLWTEKPLYTHFYGVVAQMTAQMQGDPLLRTREPYRSVANNDFSYFAELYENAAYASLAGQVFAVPFGGYTDTQYDAWARTFIKEFTHPEFGVGVEGLVYQPMVELIRYLEANDFSVYIFTADEGAFLRLVSDKLYGIPAERVQGTSVRSEFMIKEGEAQLVRSYRLEHLNNWDGKPRQIQAVVGKKPIFAAGNSNGDQHMLQYAASSGGLSVLVHHTDADREFAYDSHTDKVMPLAEQEGWTVVDMKTDWKRVFPSD